MSFRARRARGAPSPTATNTVSVSPSVGEATDTIRISCTRLRSGDTVTIGGNAATVTGGRYGTWNSSEGYPYVDVTAPAHADGAVDVVVTGYHGSDTASGAFTYQGGGSGAPTYAYTSDWSTATGNTSNACRDGTKWSQANNIATPVADRVTVIASTGLDFPAGMANVLAIRYEKSVNQSCGINVANGWALPNIGGVLCWRIYFRHDIAGTQITHDHHPVQTGSSAGTCPAAAEWKMLKGDTFRFQVANLRDGTGCNLAAPASCHLWTVTLNRNETYRIEERYERTATTTWTLHIRIYDSSDTLVFSDVDFLCTKYPHNHYLNDAATPVITTPDPECMRSRQIVNQNVSDAGGGGIDRGSDDADNNRIYYGGFAVSLQDWCGPYNVGEAP